MYALGALVLPSSVLPPPLRRGSVADNESLEELHVRGDHKADFHEKALTRERITNDGILFIL